MRKKINPCPEITVEHADKVQNGNRIPAFVYKEPEEANRLLPQAVHGDWVIYSKEQGLMLIKPEHPLHSYLEATHD
jgi:hypothetical protein